MVKVKRSLSRKLVPTAEQNEFKVSIKISKGTVKIKGISTFINEY